MRIAGNDLVSSESLESGEETRHPVGQVFRNTSLKERGLCFPFATLPLIHTPGPFFVATAQEVAYKAWGGGGRGGGGGGVGGGGAAQKKVPVAHGVFGFCSSGGGGGRGGGGGGGGG